MPELINEVGNRYGKLLVMSRSNKRTHNSLWVCICDCGKHTESYGGDLRSGKSKSCGCTSTTHGMFGTSIYGIWSGIVDRTSNSKSRDWANYGGRGITLSGEWRKFEKFYEDMGDRPENLQIERVNNDGPYSKENCVWGTSIEQANNRRTNVRITHEGKTQTVSMWARELGISPNTLSDRLKTRSVSEAVVFNPRPQQNRMVTYNGVTRTVREWAHILGLSRRGLTNRLEKMTTEEAFTTPIRTWPGAVKP